MANAPMVTVCFYWRTARSHVTAGRALGAARRPNRLRVSRVQMKRAMAIRRLQFRERLDFGWRGKRQSSPEA